MPQFRPLSPLTLLASACVALLCSCASAPVAETQPDIRVLPDAAGAASEPASSASGVARAGATTQRPATARQAAAPSGPPLPPFAALTQGSRRIDGMLTLWEKDDKVWLELKPEDFNKPMFFSPKISQGLGEGGLFGGTMLRAYSEWGAPQIVEFRKIHNLVQLVALNETFRAAAGTPQAHAVDSSLSLIHI